jgi:hypothetical protein
MVSSLFFIIGPSPPISILSILSILSRSALKIIIDSDGRCRYYDIHFQLGFS